eukprot:3037987-Rhodomonas_salina.1
MWQTFNAVNGAGRTSQPTDPNPTPVVQTPTPVVQTPTRERTRGRPRSAPFSGDVGDPIINLPGEEDSKLFHFSVTIALVCSDIDVNFYLPRLDAFFPARCKRGVASVERGGKEKRLHIQAVVEIMLHQGRQLRKILKDALGWTSPRFIPPNANICIKALSGAGIHTFIGM